MNAIFVAICSLVVLFGFEVRYRLITEEITKIRSRTNILDEEVFRLKEAVKMKKDVYDKYEPPK